MCIPDEMDDKQAGAKVEALVVSAKAESPRNGCAISSGRPENSLAEMFAEDLNVHVNPMALRMFLRSRWRKVSLLAHAIHGSKTFTEADVKAAHAAGIKQGEAASKQGAYSAVRPAGYQEGRRVSIGRRWSGHLGY